MMLVCIIYVHFTNNGDIRILYEQHRPIGLWTYNNTVCLKKTRPLQLIKHNFTNSQHLNWWSYVILIVGLIWHNFHQFRCCELVKLCHINCRGLVFLRHSVHCCCCTLRFVHIQVVITCKWSYTGWQDTTGLHPVSLSRWPTAAGVPGLLAEVVPGVWMESGTQLFSTHHFVLVFPGYFFYWNCMKVHCDKTFRQLGTIEMTMSTNLTAWLRWSAI